MNTVLKTAEVSQRGSTHVNFQCVRPGYKIRSDPPRIELFWVLLICAGVNVIMCEQLTREMRPGIILVVSVVKTTTNKTKQKQKTEKLTTNLSTSDRLSVFGDLRRKQCKLICIVILT